MTLIGIVNPRLKEHQYNRTTAGYSAMAIAGLSISTTVLLVFVLHGQCSVVCNTFQLPLIDVTDTSTCIKVGLTDDMPIYDGLQAAGSLTSAVTFGKCSFLHSQDCALSTWKSLYMCATVFDAWVSQATATDFSDWPSLMVSVDRTPVLLGYFVPDSV